MDTLKQSFQSTSVPDVERATKQKPTSPRREELLERAYEYVLEHGLAEMSLRPLATAIGSSPRVLLFLFGSKDGLVRALLARARADELAFIEQMRFHGPKADLAMIIRTTWQWLVDERHRPLLALWLEAYARSLGEPDGPWRGFAAQTVEDWLSLLAAAQPKNRRRSKAGTAERTLGLCVLRGALIDLLATGDVDRNTAAIEAHLRPASR
jgi:AcrR family transcriptional regulator